MVTLELLKKDIVLPWRYILQYYWDQNMRYTARTKTFLSLTSVEFRLCVATTVTKNLGLILPFSYSRVRPIFRFCYGICMLELLEDSPSRGLRCGQQYKSTGSPGLGPPKKNRLNMYKFITIAFLVLVFPLRQGPNVIPHLRR